MPAPPLRTAISDTYPNPSNAVARVGFGALWDYMTGLLGLTGNTPEAKVALNVYTTTTGSFPAPVGTTAERDATPAVGYFRYNTTTSQFEGYGPSAWNSFGVSATPQFDSLGVGTPASGVIGEIRATNNITAYYSSDRCLKQNIRPINNALSKVASIGGMEFQWSQEYIDSKGGEDGYFVRKDDFGVVAQDVEAVFPQAVRTRDDGSKAVDYAKLSALAFAAISELKAEVDALKAK